MGEQGFLTTRPRAAGAAGTASALPPWKLLIVDDEAGVHQVTRLALSHFRWQQRPVQLLSAYSDLEARDLVQEHPDLAIALVDVVMESENAGLDFISWLRQYSRHPTRILVRTGQPGSAPPQQVAAQHDIDGYLDKATLTADHLGAHLIIQLRAYSRALAPRSKG